MTDEAQTEKTEPLHEQCGTCRFGMQTGSPIPAAGIVITCRRFPPPARGQHRPLMQATEWCGEFQAKDGFTSFGDEIGGIHAELVAIRAILEKPLPQHVVTVTSEGDGAAISHAHARQLRDIIASEVSKPNSRAAKAAKQPPKLKP